MIIDQWNGINWEKSSNIFQYKFIVISMKYFHQADDIRGSITLC